MSFTRPDLHSDSILPDPSHCTRVFTPPRPVCVCVCVTHRTAPCVSECVTASSFCRHKCRWWPVIWCTHTHTHTKTDTDTDTDTRAHAHSHHAQMHTAHACTNAHTSPSSNLADTLARHRQRSQRRPPPGHVRKSHYVVTKFTRTLSPENFCQACTGNLRRVSSSRSASRSAISSRSTA